MLVLVACAGWGLGCLVNYLADVLPYRRRLAQPFCLVCQAEQPPLNYFIWPRWCGKCGSRRKVRVWLVEGMLVFATAATYFHPPDGLGFLISWAVLGYLALVTVIDLEHRLILHPVSQVGVALSIPAGVLLHGWQATLLGGLAGGAAMLAFYLLGIAFGKLMRSRIPEADEEALGFGDVILGAISGFLLGWPGILAGLLIAILLGGAIGLLYVITALVRRSYQPAAVFPFGPTLVAAIIWLVYL